MDIQAAYIPLFEGRRIITLEEEFQHFVGQLGQRIREIRQIKRRSQSQVSEGAGIYDVGILERGQTSNPTLYTLFVLARTMNIELKELLNVPTSQAPLDEKERIFVEAKHLLQEADIQMQRKALRVLRAFLVDS